MGRAPAVAVQAGALLVSQPPTPEGLLSCSLSVMRQCAPESNERRVI
jgi:hypothetical protein